MWATRSFIIRARKAPTGPRFSLDEMDAVRSRGLGVVAQTVANALMISKGQREDTAIWCCLEGSGAPNPPRTLLFRGDSVSLRDGVNERSIAAYIQQALATGLSLHSDQSTVCSKSGIEVSCQPLEALIKESASVGGFFYLDKRGTDWRVACGESNTSAPSIFLMTDHLKQPKNTRKLMKRLGGRPISLGPKMLFASQAVCVLHNELDRMEADCDDDAGDDDEQ